jgi:hypothetical protein
MSALGGGILLVALAVQDPRLTEVPDLQPCLNCALPARRLFRIGEQVDAILPGRPRVVAQDRRGRIYVLNIRRGGVHDPPAVYDSLGKYLGPLGRRGQGPGETTRAYWIDAGFDDTVRVFEPNRIVTFSKDLTHIRTRTEQHPVPGIRHIVVWPNGSYYAIGYEGIMPGRRTAAIHRRSSDGTRWEVVPEVERRDLFGPSRVLRSSRTKTSGLFWIAQFSASAGLGYDLLQVDTTLRVVSALRRRPRWWQSSAPSQNPILDASSRVADLRDLGNGVVAVLIAQPRDDWRTVPVDRRYYTGWWNQYTTLVEVVDTRKLILLGVARFPGYPMRILSDTRIASYVEEDDVPLLDVWRIRLRP